MMRHIALQLEAFNAGIEIAKFNQIGLGAISSFSGVVRADNDVIALSIEHHPVMTLAALEKLADDCEAQYDLSGIIIIHRYGMLKLGEPIIFVAASSAHRKDTMKAIEFAMDRLKTNVPLWKKEICKDGSEHWVEQKQSDVSASQNWGE